MAFLLALPAHQILMAVPALNFVGSAALLSCLVFWSLLYWLRRPLALLANVPAIVLYGRFGPLSLGVFGFRPF
jgi:hypothetical protein